MSREKHRLLIGATALSQEIKKMKTNIRKAILACIIALATTVAVTPAHATLSGSNPRPQPGTSGR
jgi:hypothetical protein